MTDDRDESTKSTAEGAAHSGSHGVSRRDVLTAAAAALAGGVAMAGGVAEPAAAAASIAGGSGSGPPGTIAAEFRGRIRQTGSTGDIFTAFGYLTRLAGTDVGALFDGSPPNESSALFTLFAAGQLQSRVLDTNVHALDIVGSLDVYDRASPGADFSDPSSFQVGTRVAAFDLQLQDVLSVFSPAQGIPTLTGDMRQTHVRGLSGALSGRSIGGSGQRCRMFATGLGTLVDPVTLNAVLEIAGNWSTV